MSGFNKDTQKSVRVVMPLEMYNDLKTRCIDYGDMSRVVRHLLRGWLANPKATIRQIYEVDEQADSERQRALLLDGKPE